MTASLSKPTRRPKILVIGAGPSGGSCALALARSRRFEVQLLDKSQYPRVKVCGSGLSPCGAPAVLMAVQGVLFAAGAAITFASDRRGAR